MKKRFSIPLEEGKNEHYLRVYLNTKKEPELRIWDSKQRAWIFEGFSMDYDGPKKAEIEKKIAELIPKCTHPGYNTESGVNCNEECNRCDYNPWFTRIKFQENKAKKEEQKQELLSKEELDQVTTSKTKIFPENKSPPSQIHSFNSENDFDMSKCVIDGDSCVAENCNDCPIPSKESKSIQFYQKREYCKAIKCPHQVNLEIEKERGIDSLIEKAKKKCKQNCIKKAHEFHEWLQQNGYTILKDNSKRMEMIRKEKMQIFSKFPRDLIKFALLDIEMAGLKIKNGDINQSILNLQSALHSFNLQSALHPFFDPEYEVESNLSSITRKTIKILIFLIIPTFIIGIIITWIDFKNWFLYLIVIVIISTILMITANEIEKKEIRKKDYPFICPACRKRFNSSNVFPDVKRQQCPYCYFICDINEKSDSL